MYHQQSFIFQSISSKFVPFNIELNKPKNYAVPFYLGVRF